MLTNGTDFLECSYVFILVCVCVCARACVFEASHVDENSYTQNMMLPKVSHFQFLGFGVIYEVGEDNGFQTMVGLDRFQTIYNTIGQTIDMKTRREIQTNL